MCNGPIYHGKSFGAKQSISGEAVFSTALVGYPESMTDPSYRGQILVFTQPLIGNYGVPGRDRDEAGLLKYFESPHIQAAGIVVADAALQYSHWTAVESLGDWCAREGVPAISGVDTRDIVTFLREQGSSLARITIGEEYDADEDEAFIDPEQINLVAKVSTKAPFHVSSTGDLHVAIIDCGVKENILRSLVGRGASVTCFPWDYPIHKVAHHFDGVFISNGPGDPTHCSQTVYHLRKLIDSYTGPIMGICLGHQLLALATGARTVKLKYGNRAHNIPALDLTTGRCHITSQNHGYAVDATTLPAGWKPYFINLNDQSNEGMIHETRPIMSTQFHPEAKGGPLDSSFLFDAYMEQVAKFREEGVDGIKREGRPNPLLVDLLSKERVGVEPKPVKSEPASKVKGAFAVGQGYSQTASMNAQPASMTSSIRSADRPPPATRHRNHHRHTSRLSYHITNVHQLTSANNRYSAAYAMARPLIVVTKFVGVCSLGLLTGLSFGTSFASIKALLTLPSAPAAHRSFTTLTSRLSLLTTPLTLLTALSLLSSYALSPRRAKHPYLLFTASLPVLAAAYDRLVLAPKAVRMQRLLAENGERGVNGEELRDGIVQWEEASWGSVGLYGVGFGMGVVGIWGDCA
ncbi:LOW QUALITY PROTEIN: Dihydroorotase [Drechslerella dactyloides]|uniref:Carbamoyl phosphate synthase arginine-specific small chain n=1 Tax=Drechslerella dactyloides TaxID=74499 RepID=A0AAD6IRX6_DREDA|nr:LOW QUALITY PROTEIN: Dihydroorotase [Drechslerella dactyloides]